MSGFEIAGVVLGAFPLCISAMEHYADTKRAAGTFIHIRRQHGKDYRRIKLCQAQFTLIMRQLLQPLLDGAIVDQDEYDQLLSAPGGQQWQEAHISAALSERLAEGGPDVVDALQDMMDTMTELCNYTYVHDPSFQALLKAKKEGKSGHVGQDHREIDARAIVANLAFQGRRAKYAMTGSRRDVLLDDVDKQNQTLKGIIEGNDHLVSLSQGRSSRSKLAKPHKAVLNLWSHAERIFRLLNDSWNCPCKAQHCADMWLKHRATGLVDFQMHLKFCQDVHDPSRPWTSKSVQISPCEAPTPKAIQVLAVSSPGPDPGVKKKSARFRLPWQDKQPEKVAPAVAPGVAAAAAAQPTAAKKTPGLPTPIASAQSLCKAIAALVSNTKSAITTLADHDEDEFYSLNSTADQPLNSSNVSLADLLAQTRHPKLTRIQRFGIALILASSHLQLHSTPWLHEQWDGEHVRFTLNSSDPNAASLGEPYLSKHFTPVQSTPPATSSKPDRSFVSLGIVLLELCFGYRFEECSFWSTPGIAQLKADPHVRQAMACQWLEDVEGDAGVDYAGAVEWTLRQAPVTVKDNSWRLDFAENVVQPLARNYEMLTGSKLPP